MSRTDRQGTGKRWLMVLICIFLGMTMFRHVNSAQFVGDESGWITAAYLHTQALREFDFSPERWEFPEAGLYGNLNPQVGKLMLGVPLSLWHTFYCDAPAFSKLYDFRIDRHANIAAGNLPPRDQLLAARIITACYGVLFLWTAMFVAGRAFGRGAGIATGILIAANETIVLSMSRAMTDAAYQLFSVAVCIPILYYVQAKAPRKEYVFAALAGVLAGLACSVKVTGIVLGGLVLLPLIFLKVRRPLPEWRRVVAAGCAYAVAALITVYALNPFFWPTLSTGVEADLAVAATPSKVIWKDLSRVTYDRSAIEYAYPRASAVMRPLEFPILFLRWNSLLESQLEDFKSPPPTLASYHARLFGEFALFPGDVLLVLAGCAACVLRIRGAWIGGRLSRCAVPLSFGALNYIFWTATTRVELNRYYLSPLIALQLLAGIGIAALALAGYRRYHGRRGVA